MCHTATGAAHDRPLHKEDIPLIGASYQNCLGERAVTKIAEVLTDHHSPQPAVLIAALEMAHRAKHQDRGMYPWPMMPFSVLDLDTLERVQTDEMAAFHTVFESMALAERTMDLLNGVLARELGLQLRLVCDCGCISDDFETDILGSAAYQEINLIRSVAEAAGTQVIRASTFSSPEWTSRDLDMGPREIESYQRMWGILKMLPYRSFDISASVADQVSYLRQLKGKQALAA
jgi:hypothetical protein